MTQSFTQNSAKKFFLFWLLTLLSFTVTNANNSGLVPPTINSFAPLTGPVGTTVTITGARFNAEAANNIVFFGATKATVEAASTTSLTVTVPAGATYAPITVLNAGTTLAAASATNFMPTFTPNAGHITTADIAAQVSFAAGANPNSVAIGDIDGDGRPDLVTANFGSNTVSVLRNTSTTGSPGFAEQVTFATGDLPIYVTIGDIDGDGKPDLVIANRSSSTVSVLLNTGSVGSVSFANQATFATEYSPVSVTIGDIDGDGRPDLAIANSTSSSVSVLRNTGMVGSLSFADQATFATEISPSSIAFGDIDGDGKPDLVTANSGSNSISVLRNTGSVGNLSFADQVSFTAGTSPYSIALGDIDGDSKPDLVTSNYNSSTVSVLLNTGSTGSPGFADQVTFTTGDGPRSVAIADIDGDGKPDLVTANNNSSAVSVLRNMSNVGSLGFASQAIFATGSFPCSVAIVDIDGDGQPDLVTANSSSNTISVLRNNPSFPVPPPTISSFAPLTGPVGTTITITGTNFNSKAINNIVFFGATSAVVTAVTPTSLGVTVPAGATYAPITVLNAGFTLAAYSTANFMPTFTPNAGHITTADIAPQIAFEAGDGPTSVAIGDIDGDGRPDLVTVNNASSTVSVLLNTGTAGSPSFANQVTFATGYSPNFVAIGDIDGDGKLDLVTVSYYSNTVSVLHNTSSAGSVSFADQASFATGAAPISVAIGDIDGDGRPDLATANSAGNTVSVLLNTGSAGNLSFADQATFATEAVPYSVAIGDIDGDGKPDLVTTNLNNSTVSVLRNTGSAGSLSFADQVSFATGRTPYYIAIGDINGDGRPDLATANNTNNTVSVLLNTGSVGSPGFAHQVGFAVGAAPISVAIGDIDGDGRPDLATANNSSNSNTISILRNTGIAGSLSFAPQVLFATGENPYSVAIGDIDGDGRPDLATANYTNNTVSVLRNNPFFAVPPPTISSFAPINGAVGTTVTITGSNFNTTAANNVVFFGATQAMVATATATSLTVTVPVGAIYAPVTVLNTATALAAYSAANFTPTFSPNAGHINTTDMASKVTAATSDAMGAVATGDIDGDGKPDLVITNYLANTVTVLRNIGSIGSPGFAEPVSFAVGGNPYNVAVADIDGDGRLDVVVVNNAQNTVSVLRNTSSAGNVSFVDQAIFDAGDSPSSVAVNDLDGDGKLDLAIVNSNSNTVSILRNTGIAGSLSFANKATFATGENPYFIAIGDIDGDAKPDLAVTNLRGNSVSVLRNTASAGSISFANQGVYRTGDFPNSVVIGDIDGDGKDDLVTANLSSNTVSILRNTGSIGSLDFAPHLLIEVGNGPYTATLGDIDGDGKLDLAATNLYDNTLSIMRNLSSAGNISFAPQVLFATDENPFYLTIGDVDGDGRPDVAVAHSTANKLVIFRNTPQIAAVPPTVQATSVTFTNTAIGTTTAGWTNGNGANRAVFIAAATTGSPAPENLTVYAANALFGLGTQIGSTGWYCLYNGTGSTVNITGLAAGTTYRIMVIEYNGSGTDLTYLTSVDSGNPANVTTVAQTATINTTGSLSALNTTYGMPSSSDTFNVLGANMATGILITPPPAFEVSADDITFTNTITIGATGTITSTPVYIRLKATNKIGSYAGNIVLSSTGATSVNVATVSSTVSKGTATIALSNLAQIYDGTAKSATATTDPTGLSGVTITYNGSATIPTAAGTYAVAATLTNTNYTATTVTGTLTIGTRIITVTATAKSKVYGDADPTLTYMVTTGTLVGSDAFTGALTRDVGETVNTYSIKQGTLKLSSNYMLSYVSANLVITKTQLTITASNSTRIYGIANPAFTLSHSGFVNGDTKTSLTSQAEATTMATVGSNVGSYEIIPAGAVSTNYNFVYVNGILSITPANRTISFTQSITATYGDVDIAPAATASSGEMIIYNSDNANVATIVNGKVHLIGAGTANITASLPANANYNATTPITQALLVNKAKQLITFTSIPVLNRVSGTYDLGGVTSSSGLPVTLLVADPLIASIRGTTLTANRIGNTIVTATQAGNANYLAATAETQVVRVVDAVSGNEMIIRQAVSPNGDGINDFLYIEGIGDHQANRVTVVNRNGVKVFSISNYDNSSRVFDGHSTNGKMQQAGTYFYVVEFEGKRLTGWFVLKY